MAIKSKGPAWLFFFRVFLQIHEHALRPCLCTKSHRVGHAEKNKSQALTSRIRQDANLLESSYHLDPLRPESFLINSAFVFLNKVIRITLPIELEELAIFSIK